MTDTPINPPDTKGASDSAPRSDLRPEPRPESRTEIRPELRAWCEEWKTCVQTVLSQISRKPTGCEMADQVLPATTSDVWYTVVAGGTVHGEMSLRLGAADGTRVAQLFLGETPGAGAGAASEAITTESKEALEELLRQIAGLAATALTALVGGEVQLHLAASESPT